MVIGLVALVIPFAATSAKPLPGKLLIASWSDTYKVTTLQETSSRIKYRGPWARADYPAYLGDKVRFSNARGASVSLRFQGSGISWVGPVGPTRGVARVYVDGRLVRTVNTHARHFKPTQVLFQAKFGRYGTHTLKIVTLGTQDHPTVAVDALVVRGKKKGFSNTGNGAKATPAPTATAAATPEATAAAQATATPDPTGATPTAAPTAAPTAKPTATPVPTPKPTATSSVDGTVVPVGGLAAAVSNASNGDTLLLRGGDHLLSSEISTSKSLTIQNYPGESPVITHPSARPDFLYFKGGPVVVRGITFRAGGPAFDDSMGSAASEVDGGFSVLYDNVTFIGDPDMTERQQLLYVRYGSTVTIRNCKFVANGTDGFGVHVYPGESTDPKVIVEGSTFSGFGVSAAITSSSRITIRNNTFRDSREAIQLRSYASSSTITNNDSTNVTTGIEVGSGVSNLNISGNSWN
jgi:hypothetical protein